MNINEFYVKAGFEIKEGDLIKESNGYQLMLREFQQGYVRVMGVLVFLGENVLPDKLKELKKKVGSNKIRYIDSKKKNILLYSLDSLYGKIKEEKIQQEIKKIELFTIALNELNIKKQEKCIFCGQDLEEELIYSTYNGMYLPQHASCREKAKSNAILRVAKENLRTELYPVSIFLGVVGAILATILINIFVYFILDGTMYAIMYAAVPLAAYFGYKIGKAPKNKKMITSIIISSVVGTLLVDLIFFMIIAAGLGLTFTQFISQNLADILRSELIVLLFLGIGIYITWNVISKTNDRDVKKFN